MRALDFLEDLAPAHLETVVEHPQRREALTDGDVTFVFRHVEAIAFDPSRKRNSAESLRIGVTLADATESERVVHLNAKQQAAVDKAEHTLESELRKIASNPHIALAALARVAQRRLSK